METVAFLNISKIHKTIILNITILFLMYVCMYINSWTTMYLSYIFCNAHVDCKNHSTPVVSQSASSFPLGRACTGTKG